MYLIKKCRCLIILFIQKHIPFVFNIDAVQNTSMNSLVFFMLFTAVHSDSGSNDTDIFRPKLLAEDFFYYFMPWFTSLTILCCFYAHLLLTTFIQELYIFYGNLEWNLLCLPCDNAKKNGKTNAVKLEF